MYTNDVAGARGDFTICINITKAHRNGGYSSTCTVVISVCREGKRARTNPSRKSCGGKRALHIRGRANGISDVAFTSNTETVDLSNFKTTCCALNNAGFLEAQHAPQHKHKHAHTHTHTHTHKRQHKHKQNKMPIVAVRQRAKSPAITSAKSGMR